MTQTIQIGPSVAVVADKVMKDLYEDVGSLAKTPISSALVVGETGVGKELVASALHHWSKRCLRPFLTINCGAIPEPLFEDVLFGHERGSFTGAHTQRIGVLQAADGGTVVIDDIDTLSLHLQGKLLDVLDTGRIQRVGGTQMVTDLRIVATTNADLKSCVSQGSFRKDLYFRFCGNAPFEVPPLRERPCEIPLLADHFLSKVRTKAEFRPAKLSAEAQLLLSAHDWPGNVRELRLVVERAGCVSPKEEIPASVLAKFLGTNKGHVQVAQNSDLTLRPHIERLERTLILQAMERAKYKRIHAAQILGIPVRTLFNKLRKYNLPLGDDAGYGTKDTKWPERVTLQ